MSQASQELLLLAAAATLQELTGGLRTATGSNGLEEQTAGVRNTHYPSNTSAIGRPVPVSRSLSTSSTSSSSSAFSSDAASLPVPLLPTPQMDLLRQIAPTPFHLPPLPARNPPMTAFEERRTRRLMRNRLAAKECRQKKKAFVQELEQKLQTGERDIAALEAENEALRRENEILRARLRACQCDGMDGLDFSSDLSPATRKRQRVSSEDSSCSVQNSEIDTAGPMKSANQYVASPEQLTPMSPMDALLAAVASETSQ
ncbi:hypothetical protein HDV00_011604 [Rhizophlyctis rosea]|nr:hypothetical protein HDV00_011604 [Rhizophlyctis rosea]